MAHAMRAVRKASTSTVPRGLMITVLALMSWGVVLAGWKAISLSIGMLFGL